MLSSTALDVPRFSMTRDRRSTSTRRRSFPKFARALKAETTIVPFLSVVVVAIYSPFQLSELYSLAGVQLMELIGSGFLRRDLSPALPFVSIMAAALVAVRMA